MLKGDAVSFFHQTTIRQDWTKYLNRQTKKLTDITLKLRIYNQSVNVINKLVKSTVERTKHQIVLNADFLNFVANVTSTQEFKAAVYNSAGQLKLDSLLFCMGFACKEVSSMLQPKYVIDECIFQAHSALTDIQNWLSVLSSVEKQVDEKHLSINTSVSIKKKKYSNHVCTFSTPVQSSGEIESQNDINLDISALYKDEDNKFIQIIKERIDRKKQKSFGEYIFSVQSKTDVTPNENRQDLLCKLKNEDKTVTLGILNGPRKKLLGHKKQPKIPTFRYKPYGAKNQLFSSENLGNKTLNIKGKNGTDNLPEIVTNTPPSMITKEHLDSIVDSLCSPSHEVMDMENMERMSPCEKHESDSFGIFNSLTDSLLEDAEFPGDFSNLSMSSNSFSSPVLMQSESSITENTTYTEVSTSVKRKPRPSIQAIIDRYKALKTNKIDKETVVNTN